MEDDQTHHRGIIGPDLKNLLTDFLGKSFTDQQEKLFAHNFQSVMTLGKITSQVVEVENSALKQHGSAPGPKDGIHMSQNKIADRNDQKNRRRRRRAAINMMKMPTKAEGQGQPCFEVDTQLQ